MIYQLQELIPNIHETSFVAPNATVIGDVTTEKGSSIWFNVVIRADMDKVSVGENSNVQDGSILHVDQGFPLIISKNVTVGHKVMLHGCTIGENSLIGMNAVILNGAKIGKNCIIGANALVTENMEIPDNHLVMGSPAKIIKPIDQATAEKLKGGAQHYVENAQHFLQHLTPVIMEK